MPTPFLQLTLVQFAVTLVGALAVSAGALFYFRRVELERPPVGTFNGRDIGILMTVIIGLPFLYATLPRWALTCFLGMTFASALSIGYRPLLGPTRLWLGVGLLLGSNIWTSRTMLGSVVGWQLWWVELGVLVALSAIAVANLYVQGGMKLRYVAWFALALGGYDVTFSRVIPLTNKLVQGFLGNPLDPSLGMRFGINNYSIGIGDLLVFAMFAVAAYKAYGRSAARLALAVIVVFGVCVPSLVPLVINFIDARTDLLVPSQAFFGPAAFLCYLWLKHRYGRERTMAEYRSSTSIAPAAPPSPTRRPAPRPASVAAGA
ncbi:MAG: hypothetical protein M3326_05360 [Actinomycetota bacterium]|nr:hypothetical protein [Actinomycetota bacterium]